MEIHSNSFHDGEPIPSEFAFCRADPGTHARPSDNRSPQINWSDLPVGTHSLVLICHDPDVPSRPDDVNQEGRTVAAELPRIDFYHWVLVDIPTSLEEIETGADSDVVTPRGKDQVPGPGGCRRGLNNYTDWFEGDPDMEGHYFGYDGPCPPWNDTIRHRYVFTLYALDCDRCPIDGNFRGDEVMAAIEGHVLAQASITGTYSLNPDVPA